VNQNCPFCNKEISPTDVFCPHCGNKLPDKKLPFSSVQRIKIYLVSIILAPVGLYWFFKYFKNEDLEKRKVAYVALYLTIFMIIVLIVVNFLFVDSWMKYINIYSQNNYNF